MRPLPAIEGGAVLMAEPTDRRPDETLDQYATRLAARLDHVLGLDRDDPCWESSA
jgi:hypothetical protein